MRWIAVMVCATLALGLAGLYGLRNSLRSNFGGEDTVMTVSVVGHDGWYFDPGSEVDPERARQAGYDTCSAQSVDVLAGLFKTKATAKAVAKGYARSAHEPAVYEGCLGAFRD